jgi:hypothetical protein
VYLKCINKGGVLTPPPLRRGIRKADTFKKYRDVISRGNLVLICILMQVSLKSINMDKHSLYLLGTPFSRASSRDDTSSPTFYYFSPSNMNRKKAENSSMGQFTCFP